MACPFFTTMKMITALMLLFFGFMQFMSLRKKWVPVYTKMRSGKETDEEETSKETSHL